VIVLPWRTVSRRTAAVKRRFHHRRHFAHRLHTI